jgi:hypothetical protein
MDCVTRETAGRNKSGVAVAAVAVGGPLGGDRAGGQGDGRVGQGEEADCAGRRGAGEGEADGIFRLTPKRA